MKANYIVRRYGHYINTLSDNFDDVITFIRENVIPRSALEITYGTKGNELFGAEEFPKGMDSLELVEEAKKVGYTFDLEETI